MTVEDSRRDRVNGLFAVGSDAPNLDAPNLDAPNLDAPVHDAPVDDRGRAETEAPEDVGSEAGSAAGSAVGPLLGALEEAGPEAAEHLVNAAHEFTLAVKVVVDAFERGLAEQREILAAQGADLVPGDVGGSDRASNGIRRIDVE